MPKNKKFKIIQHTADIGLEVYGKNYKELFVNSAFGLLKIVYQNKCVTQKHKIKIIIEGSNYENLLVKWLNEIIYQIYVNKKIFSKFQIKELNQKKLFAFAFGDDFAPDTITREVKSATYHNLNIKKNNGLLKTKIIFDV